MVIYMLIPSALPARKSRQIYTRKSSFTATRGKFGLEQPTMQGAQGTRQMQLPVSRSSVSANEARALQSLLPRSGAYALSEDGPKYPHSIPASIEVARSVPSVMFEARYLMDLQASAGSADID
jgi:hypothetical protein